MNRFITFLKSPVGRFHSAFALFILFNLLSGLVNLWIYYLPWLAFVHFYTGLLILAAPLVYLLATKNRGIVGKAFLKMVMPAKGDKRRQGVPFFKLVTGLTVLLVFVNALCGVFMKLGVLPVLAYNIHVFDFEALLFLVPLHALLAATLRRERAEKKPAKHTSAGNTVH